MDKPEFVYVIYIAATPAAVWDGLTSGDFTQQYWGGLRIQSDWKVGSPVIHVGRNGTVGLEGEVLEAERPRVLAYTFHMLVGPEKRSEQPSRVRFEVEPVGSMVRLTLTHDRFEQGSATFEDTRHGWPAIMGSLKTLLETGAPLPFTRLGFAPAQRSSERIERSR
jgi:uncharacterized protein YndB with AHSA1/START domain